MASTEAATHHSDFKCGILAFDPFTKNLSPIVTRFNGKIFKGPNDLEVDRNGAIIFTDQGMTGLQDPTGVYIACTLMDKWMLLLRNCSSPNGLVFNKEETSLFVAMTRDNSIWHVPLYPDLMAPHTGRFSSYYGIGGPDGMAIDVEGNLFAAHSSLGVIFVTGRMESRQRRLNVQEERD